MDLVEKNKNLIDLLKWDENHSVKIVQAFKCDLNQGILNEHGDIYPLTANIYVCGFQYEMRGLSSWLALKHTRQPFEACSSKVSMDKKKYSPLITGLPLHTLLLADNERILA
jgi:hypothetical protein